MSREKNVMVFQDTEKSVKSNAALSEMLKNQTRDQRLILEGEDYPGADTGRYGEEAKIVVSGKRTFEAASFYRGRKTCVLNFASATNPGGGVVRGSFAQEECLCRCSTLYFSLNTPKMWEGFYTPHRNEGNPIHNDDIIYTPDVCVFKTDTEEPEMMPEKDWYLVNVITCAAPNLRRKPGNMMNAGDGSRQVKVTDRELLAIHEKRLTRILDVAANEGNEVVILGAFGCGAFENKPEVVAQAARNALKNYMRAFRTIEFAVFCSPRDNTNYAVFKRML